MNQIIIIGEVVKIEETNANLFVEIKTKDYQKATINLSILVESGYQPAMVEVLKKQPFIAVKCGLKLTRGKINLIAEKMSVLKLTEEEKSEN